jgi:hypothetical protein
LSAECVGVAEWTLGGQAAKLGRVASDDRLRADFTPLQRPSLPARVLALVVAPLLWLVALVVVAVVVKRGHAVEVGLIAALAAFLLALFVSVIARRLRVREERAAEHS